MEPMQKAFPVAETAINAYSDQTRSFSLHEAYSSWNTFVCSSERLCGILTGLIKREQMRQVEFQGLITE